MCLVSCKNEYYSSNSLHLTCFTMRECNTYFKKIAVRFLQDQYCGSYIVLI